MSRSTSEAKAATRATFWRLPLEYVRPFLVGSSSNRSRSVGPPRAVQSSAQPAVEIDDLAAGEIAPQGHIAGDVGDAAVQLDGVLPGVLAQEPGRAAVGAQQTEQDADRRGLPGAVGSEEAVYLTGPDMQIEAVQRVGAAEGLVETVDPDRGSGRDCLGHALEGTLTSQICEVKKPYKVGVGGSDQGR